MSTTKFTKTFYKHTCNRCGASWDSAVETPKSCAKCRNPYWNKERVRK